MDAKEISLGKEIYVSGRKKEWYVCKCNGMFVDKLIEMHCSDVF